MKYTSIGGQAVLEGVMMQSKTSRVMSVRRSDGSIAVEKEKIASTPWRKTVGKIPIVRGVVAFVDSFINGMMITTKSAEMYGEDALADEEPSKFEKWLSKTTGIKIETVAIVVGVVLGLAFSILLFIFLPMLARRGMEALGVNSKLGLDAIEGVIKILIFIGYILLISLMKDIKRLFMYHGAEHKVISCYEHGDELTVENARKYSTSHPRCGTSFIFIVMVIGIIFASVADNLFGLSTATPLQFLIRFCVKLLLLPLTAGISYEILKLLAKSDNCCFRILRSPGMLLQKLTTRQPDDSMLEVSLTSFKNVLYMDGLMEEPVTEETTEEDADVAPATDEEVKKAESGEEA